MNDYPKYRLTVDQISWADQLAERRSGSMGHRNTPLSRNPNMKSLLRHKIGARAEVVYSLHTGYPVDDKTIGIGDTGTDFPDGAQVKGSNIKKMPNILIPIEDWPRKPPKFYVLVWVQNMKFKRSHSYILGKISREEADRVKEFKPKGFMGFYCDNYVIWNKYLEPVGPGIHQEPEPVELIPGDCNACPAGGKWPWYGKGLWCFYEAYFLGKSAKPKLCDDQYKNCQLST